MGNRIEYASFIFTDEEIVSGECVLSNSLIASELAADHLSLTVKSDATGIEYLLTADDEIYQTKDNEDYVIDTGNLASYVYGTPLFYYKDNVLIGKFYIESVTRTGVTQFKLECTSAIGILATKKHAGGMYAGATAGSVIDEIMGDMEYSISPDVAAVPVYGWLPYASCRDNLMQLLFITGASVLKNADGSMHIAFLDDDFIAERTKNLTDVSLGLGGEVNYLTPATRVDITEHSFRAFDTDSEVVLFDNTDGSGAVANKIVTFDNPCHDLESEDLTIVSSGVNYAVVTGTGKLTGKEYTHVTKTFSVETGAEGEENVVEISDAYLVNELNSANLAARVRAYYGSAKEIGYDFIVGSERPCDPVNFEDPFGDDRFAFIKSMDISISKRLLKAPSVFAIDWTPGPFGNNFTHFQILSGLGQWRFDPPGGSAKIRCILIGGGQGGKGGQAGFIAPYINARHTDWDYPENYSQGGKGQAPGSPGKVYVFDYDADRTIYLNYSTGNGGPGGAPGTVNGEVGEDGDLGGATYLQIQGSGIPTVSHNSDEGTVPPAGWMNVLTGDIYAKEGKPGHDGANGGCVEQDSSEYVDAQDLIIDGETYHGGARGARYDWPRRYGEGSWQMGGLGGGAAFGSDGEDGEDGNMQERNHGNYVTGDIWTIVEGTEGIGGDGADAEANPDATVYGSGGDGGNGGGGAGQGGLAREYDSNGSDEEWDYSQRSNGNVGAGSYGSKGGPGVLMVLW